MSLLEFNSPGGEERKTLFADIIIPLSLPKPYTYRIPFNLNQEIKIGQRVIVPLGKSKLYTGIVWEIHEKNPKNYEAKYIYDILDDYPMLNTKMIQLWNWMHDYYLSSLGEIMQAAIPLGFKLESEKVITLNPDYIEGSIELSKDELLIIDILISGKQLKAGELEKITTKKNNFHLIKSLYQKGIISWTEELNEKYIPKKKKLVYLNPIYAENKEELEKLYKNLEKRSPKQIDVLLFFDFNLKKGSKVFKEELNQNEQLSYSAIQSLIKKEILLEKEIIVDRIQNKDSEKDIQENQLNEAQSHAFKEIKKYFEKGDIVLLNGLTGSGKTHIYYELIKDNLNQGKQVLFLLPEIALTYQIVQRLQKYFGSQVGVFHSRFGTHERVEIWNKISSGEINIIVGARSAVFMPFNNLGLVIVDEEHEISYKQFDPSPRYHGRDTAIYLAKIHNAKTLLGSATPSMESIYNVNTNKYGFVNLNSRFSEGQLPDIEIVDLAESTRKKEIKGIFSKELFNEIQNKLNQKEQVILFQNRKGFSSIILCETCGWIPKCINCDISLTYYKSNNRLKCHYCGYNEDLMSHCNACGSHQLKTSGFGTERLEEDLQLLLPNARIARFDLETTKTKNSYQQIMHDFETGNTEILIGTQLVAKGLDFESVGLVGILQADLLLNFPDFRANERSYQLMVQVAGRAGRKKSGAKVIIQSYRAKHPLLEQIKLNDINGFINSELIERLKYQYPPYFRLIKIILKNPEYSLVKEASDNLGRMLKPLFGEYLLGPEASLIPRIKNQFIFQMVIKIEKGKSNISLIKKSIIESLDKFRTNKTYQKVNIQIDVDPY